MASTVAVGCAEGTGAARRTRAGDSPTRRRGLAAGGIGRAARSSSAPALPTVVVVSTAPVLAAQAPPRPGDRPAGPALRWLRGWAAVTHLVLGLVIAIPCLVLTVLLVVGVATVPAFGVGIPILAGVLFGARGMAAFERARFKAFTNVDLVPPPPPAHQPAWRRGLLPGRPGGGGGGGAGGGRGRPPRPPDPGVWPPARGGCRDGAGPLARRPALVPRCAPARHHRP